MAIASIKGMVITNIGTEIKEISHTETDIGEISISREIELGKDPIKRDSKEADGLIV